MLWGDGPERLLDALDARQRYRRPFPADLFEAAGILPAGGEQQPHVEKVRPDLIQPLHLAVEGHRNASLFEHVRILADTTNRPRTASGQIDVPAWIDVVTEMALESWKQMRRPRLDRADYQSIAYSIGTWSASGHALRDHSPRQQSDRGRRSGAARRASVRDRDVRIVALLEEGATMRAAAAAVGVHYSTAARARSRLLHEPVRGRGSDRGLAVLGGRLLDLLNQSVESVGSAGAGAVH